MLDKMAGLLREYEWSINSCGQIGQFEMLKIQTYVPQVLKILINYI
jgi:hypothetical protein